MIPKHEYREAIKALELAMTQLQPDGKSCVICGDTDHQAWECLHNPLVMANKGFRLEDSWRCFQCNKVFTDYDKAKEHFGDNDFGRPQCCGPEIIIGDTKMILVNVRWWDGYLEAFECQHVRQGGHILWLRLTNGQNRTIPLIGNVRWFSTDPESHAYKRDEGE